MIKEMPDRKGTLSIKEIPDLFGSGQVRKIFKPSPKRNETNTNTNTNTNTSKPPTEKTMKPDIKKE
jgi:hypothetical protein